MNYFLDTNVKIGYVFCTDPWNDESVKLLESDNAFYNSNCVEKEFNKKYDYIMKEQKNFFYSLRECWQKLLDFEHFSFTPLDFFNIFLS